MLIETAEALWNSLNSAGRLSPKSHDKKFVEDLREGLKISPDADIGEYLKAKKIGPTPFLIAVVNALQPFSMMLNDIYAMFAEGGVRHSNDEVLIQFDFGEADKLKFDAENFRTALKTLEKLNSVVSMHAFKPGDLNNISGGVLHALARRHPAYDANARASDAVIIGNRNGQPVEHDDATANDAANAWINHSSGWPYLTPPPLPQWSAGDPLGQAITPLSNAVEQLCFRTSRYTSQIELRKARSSKGAQTDKRIPISLWSEDLLAWVQDDHPVRFSYLRVLWLCHELAPKNANDRMAFAIEIKKLISEHSDIEQKTQSTDVLNDLLNLPIWQQRSQLYSVWLITVLKRELKSDERFELQGTNGRLDFAFAQTHIADLHIGQDVLKLVAELRTSANGIVLAGKGRKQNIQPDYALIQSTPGEEDRVIYILEAKQYAKASTRNFNEALLDYARVHTRALVALANHGPIPVSQPEKLIKMCKALGEKYVSERCQAFAEVNPAKPMAIAGIRDHFRLVLTDYSSPLPLLMLDVSSSMNDALNAKGRLAWEKVSEDIAESGMRAAYARNQLKIFQPGEPVREALRSLFDNAVDGPLRLCDLPIKANEPVILLTDEDGFYETIGHHRKLAGVIILQPDCSLILRMNEDSEPLLRRTLGRLIAATSVGERY
ncbi:hypothetical protein [Pseudomonas moraviensis]|uniref:Uncharacterized protein n=1 Tax=Pseudomonas moraviensis TaxID=321662 RepID=A0A7Y9W0W7_9PSED|nr:hypothetical protein [Pseudomonas moraviensis]NYH12176.1 hypothetical protein [Pseudomonas moraviensis]